MNLRLTQKVTVPVQSLQWGILLPCLARGRTCHCTADGHFIQQGVFAIDLQIFHFLKFEKPGDSHDSP